MKITVWGDFACPFCYMEEVTLEKILDEKISAGEKVPEIELRAYQLAPEAPVIPVESMTQHFCSEHDITPDEARSRMEHISRMAERAGLSYNLEGVKVCNTFDAHRLIKLAYATADAATALKLGFAFFHANFVENRRLSDHAVLKEIAVGAGLAPDAVETTLAGNLYADAVRADEKEADGLGLELVPFMRFPDGQKLQGIISAGAMRKAL